MIYIAERQSKKNVGKTSLFIKFDYNQEYINIIKQAENAIWHKKDLEWELPINKLAFLIDNFSLLDDIELSILPDEQKEKLDLTLDYKTKPFDYQEDGIRWLINNPNGLLTDVPGLGKTLQVTYACDELRAQKNIEHVLIICGINSLKTNWKKEIAKHSRSDSVVIGEQINSKGKIYYTSVKERAKQLYEPIEQFFVIMNVEMLTSDLVVDSILHSKNNFDVIVVDEIHKCKGVTSQRGKNLLKLAKVGKYHYGLTGTLLINSPLDAYMPLRFTNNERSTFSAFKDYYCVYKSNQFTAYQIAGFKNIADLKDEIAACSLRRTKDILNLPPKTIITEYVEMDEIHEKFYEHINEGVVEEADRVNIKNNSLLGLVVRLRQAATCPHVLSSSITQSCKIDRAVDLAEEIVSTGEKVVIFSTFKEPLDILYDRLKEYNPVKTTGDTSAQESSQCVDKFTEDPICNIFISTVWKSGTGLTLTSASYMIFIDAPWTWSDFDQCCDRIHRIGTTDNVTIYNLIAKNTIDERINATIEMKKGISDVVVDGDYNQTEELRALLGLKEVN